MYNFGISAALAADMALGKADSCPLYPNPFPPPGACWSPNHGFFTTQRGPGGGASVASPVAPPPPQGTWVQIPDTGKLGQGGWAVLSQGSDNVSGTFDGAQFYLGGQASGALATLLPSNNFQDLSTQQGKGLSIAFQAFYTPGSGAFDELGERVSTWAPVLSIPYGDGQVRGVTHPHCVRSRRHCRETRRRPFACLVRFAMRRGRAP